jgi:diguanylate cyclase (GGDEF)-like protein/putative nucleotidyltransferase with HDIG domain
VLTSFVRQGLERGDKVLYVVDAHTAEAVLDYLRDDGLDVEPFLACGQLAILSHDEAYMQEGLFDPEGMIALLRAETDRALAQGYPALRVTGEMTWALQGLPGSERLIEYEAKLNEFFPGSNCLAICQYDQRAFSPALLLDVLYTHPIAIVGTAVYDNFCYVPPTDLLSDAPPGAQLRHWLEQLAERKQAEEERERLHGELEMRAITDSLTGLYDHAHFYKRLAEEIDRSRRYNHGFALLLMDVDDFKRFNDSRGHKVGDEMLRLVAHCIPAGLRRSDLAFRYGGDEFAAILPHADSSKARAAVDHINRRITKRLRQMDGDDAARLTLTAGVACFPDDGTSADELVRIADATLYNAKWVARARDIMGQKEDIQSLVSALASRQGGVEGSAEGAIFRPEALHEQQARIVSSVASSIAVALKDAGVAQALEDPDLQVLATVGAAAEIKDRYIRGHPERMSERAVALAEEMGLSAERVRDIRIAALLHDIGKVTVSEGILNKPGKLSRREFASVKDHPIVGATLVSQVRGFERLAKIVRHHHERFDGTGYPDGLAGEDIPPESRILSVLDVFDALTHQRSYRNAMSREEAIAVIERGAGTQFDPMVVKAFLALMKRQGDMVGAPAEAAGEDRQLADARAAGRRKG